MLGAFAVSACGVQAHPRGNAAPVDTSNDLGPEMGVPTGAGGVPALGSGGAPALGSGGTLPGIAGVAATSGGVSGVAGLSGSGGTLASAGAAGVAGTAVTAGGGAAGAGGAPRSGVTRTRGANLVPNENARA